MTRKKPQHGPQPGTVYNEEEVKEMAERGYVTPRAAADELSVRIDRVYRAIKAKQVRTKTSGEGEKVHRYYVHRGDWLKLVEKQREKLKAELGLE